MASAPPDRLFLSEGMFDYGEGDEQSVYLVPAYNPVDRIDLILPVQDEASANAMISTMRRPRPVRRHLEIPEGIKRATTFQNGVKLARDYVTEIYQARSDAFDTTWELVKKYKADGNLGPNELRAIHTAREKLGKSLLTFSPPSFAMTAWSREEILNNLAGRADLELADMPAYKRKTKYQRHLLKKQSTQQAKQLGKHHGTALGDLGELRPIPKPKFKALQGSIYALAVVDVGKSFYDVMNADTVEDLEKEMKNLVAALGSTATGFASGFAKVGLRNILLRAGATRLVLAFASGPVGWTLFAASFAVDIAIGMYVEDKVEEHWTDIKPRLLQWLDFGLPMHPVDEAKTPSQLT